MLALLFNSVALVIFALAAIATAQSSSTSGYVGYNLTLEGEEDSVVYATDDTEAGASATVSDPDVYLNATVFVGEIDLQVDNLTAKINLDAQVLNLLSFNAGVDLSIDQVDLLIQNISAKVILEARLENLLLMINDTLNSIDLNPIIATLGQDVGSVLNSTTSAVGSTVSSAASALDKRSYDLIHNVLYSINDYSGNTHTNRVLAQDGDIVDKYLDNDGNAHGQKIIGTYESAMTFTGYHTTIERNGLQVQEREYRYSPFHGISVISAVYTDGDGSVVGTQVLAESNAGGSSTVGDL
ncbi:hypothetical protein LTR36_009298 [Oleoguttula mirabilis]|uniref:Uncharacterized protein n=1 Tax=Oleoguttula mirabilis TaxID=1507867 RepID=A0AAV9J6L4_9PEZI|nr:hypothetical protein LTR36_009298 [Oleoguttula mirabilis]